VALPDNFSGRQGKRGNREASRAFPLSWPILLSSPSWSLPRSWPILGSLPYWFTSIGRANSIRPYRGSEPWSKNPPPFQLTPFDPPSEISQSKPCHPVCVLGHAVGIPAAISGAFPNQPPRKTPHFRATSKLCLQFYLALFFLETLASGL